MTTGKSEKLNQETELVVADLLAEAVSREQPDALRRLFAAHGLRSLVIIWNPELSDLANPLLVEFAVACRSMAGPGGRLHEFAFDLHKFGALVDHMMVLTPEDEGIRFRYRHYGNAIVNHYSRDMTGRTTDEFPGHISQFFAALYRAAGQRGEPVLSEHEPPKTVFASYWQRLIFPVFGADGQASAFAVLNHPKNQLRAALELLLDPMLVVDRTGTVIFANRAARFLFGLTNSRSDTPRFEEVLGSRIALPEDPGDFLDRRIGAGRFEIERLGKQVGAFDVVLSPVVFRDSYMFVVSLRP